MIRHFRILSFAISTLTRHRAKTLVIVIVYSMIVCLLASLLLFVAFLQREAHVLLNDAPDIIVQRLRGGRHDLMPADRVRVIEQIRGVRHAIPRVWGYYYDPPTSATITFWGADSAPRAALEGLDGAWPGSDDSTSILVGQGLADVRFLGLGDRLPIKMNNGELFAPRVAGIFVAPSALLTNDLVVMPTDQLRSVFGFGAEECTDIAVEVPQTSEIATVTRKIYEAWPDVRVVSREQIRHTYEAIFDWRGGLWLAVLIGTIAAFAVLVWDKATGLSAEEYRTIGLLKAVGWTTRDVLELKACEGSIVSLVSVLSGLLLAQLHLIWLDGALFAHVLKGWSVQFPPFDIAPRLDAYTLLVCLPLAVVPYVAAGLVPAWRTAIIDPDSVIRS